MYFTANNLDDLLHKCYTNLLARKQRIHPSKGWATEITGALLRLRNPRARLSLSETKGTVFSCLGEFCWYMAASDELNFIKYYIDMYDQFSDDGSSVHGAYGPRLFALNGTNQIDNIISILKSKTDSRQAVIQLFDANDIIGNFKDVPCTCTIQFLLRRGLLHVHTNMRSNDAYLGLPHDLFSFTMLQEYVARKVDAELGTYSHSVGSFHLYGEHRELARQYLMEGWHLPDPMSPMPKGDPEEALRLVLEAERQLRNDETVSVEKSELPPFWSDLVGLLEIYKITKGNSVARQDLIRLATIKREMSTPIFNNYIRKRERRIESPEGGAEPLLDI